VLAVRPDLVYGSQDLRPELTVSPNAIISGGER
jgi:hypothetical protein